MKPSCPGRQAGLWRETLRTRSRRNRSSLGTGSPRPRGIRDFRLHESQLLSGHQTNLNQLELVCVPKMVGNNPDLTGAKYHRSYGPEHKGSSDRFSLHPRSESIDREGHLLPCQHLLALDPFRWVKLRERNHPS
jgi:hypothetical protein